MFWSPAVTRFSVTGGCAQTGRPSASPASVAMMPSLFMVCPPCPLWVLRLRVRRRRVEMQSCRRQGDADRLADREPARIVDQIMMRPDAHGIAVEPAGIGALDDLAAQDEAALGSPIRRAQPRVLAAEMGIEGDVSPRAADAAAVQQRAVDGDAVPARAVTDRHLAARVAEP